MAKVQGKKVAVRSARRAAHKVAATRKKVVKRVAAPVKAAKKAVKAVARKAAAKPVKALKAVKAKAGQAKAVKAKAVKATKPLKPAKRAALAKPVAVAPAKAKAPVAANVPPAPRAVDAKKVRARRPRPRIHSNGAPVAAWLPQGEKPRPSSFIPAPARAEAPSLIAAPPASSDRLIRPEDVTEFVTRTVPIRVDIEQGGGRVYIGVNPEDVNLRPGEGIEWDFRYLGGADVTVDEVMIEFEKPSPFANLTFRSRKPGTARPHRQLSGPAQPGASGRRMRYVVRAMTPFKTELASAAVYVTIS